MTMQEVPVPEVQESEIPEPEAQPFNEEQTALIKTQVDEAIAKAVTEANEVSGKRFPGLPWPSLLPLRYL